ncbi:uncharacterized protein LY89DRAFT_727685 [Mollisia scopiformis]|uniref:Transcription factor domain-containing protein n=1 Tax=Mollisia scopiformis TaxID=149040 RepID=A0A194XWX9_MOLSC|nr:uncharacterized protein LY89DRAFT_727685 [Mollisia scopiformis]KUJ24666.1 hypothetical protein LY89DRAFT_727685 [Mollisia scopiformis]
MRFEYDCYYEDASLKRPRTRSPDPISAKVPSAVGVSSANVDADSGDIQKEEVNSGTAFAQALIAKFNNAGSDSGNLAWNLGIGAHDAGFARPPISSIISENEMLRLSRIYFSTIHELYGFLDVADFNQRVSDRWRIPDFDDHYDAVFCGVAALGSLFSGGNPCLKEVKLVQLAKDTLETSGLASRPPQTHVIARMIFRTLYLRCTSQPHAAWMSSCMTIHSIECIEDRETGESSVQEIEIRNRIFLIARIQNTWIANEYGRSKLDIRGVSYPLPNLPAGDGLADLFHLFQISGLLDPDNHSEASDFEQGIADLVEFRSPRDAITLSQCNLGLALYRRLRIISPQIPQEISGNIISLGIAGLEAVNRLVIARQPWWHVANVPFQFVCISLAMDTPKALRSLENSIKTLEVVAQYFPKGGMEEASRIATLLVWLARKRKQEDMLLLDTILENRSAPASSMDLSQLWEQTQPYSKQMQGSSYSNLADVANDDWDALLMVDWLALSNHEYRGEGWNNGRFEDSTSLVAPLELSFKVIVVGATVAIVAIIVVFGPVLPVLPAVAVVAFITDIAVIVIIIMVGLLITLIAILALVVFIAFITIITAIATIVITLVALLLTPLLTLFTLHLIPLISHQLPIIQIVPSIRTPTMPLTLQLTKRMTTTPPIIFPQPTFGARESGT